MRSEVFSDKSDSNILSLSKFLLTKDYKSCIIIVIGRKFGRGASMTRERICPICGGMIERRTEMRENASGAYGTRLDLRYACEDPLCGFSVAFPFDGSVYTAYACEEIRRRTVALPADERARALLSSVGYCRRSDDDPLSEELSAQVGQIFAEALGEILRDARGLLRALSHREPDRQRKREMRERLKVFFDFIALMEGRFPTPKLETEFYAIRDGLVSLDSAYELGMLALENDDPAAETYFEMGIRAGGIRSRVAYAKYILSDRADTAEEREALKESFLALASESQEACYEYMCRSDIGRDDLSRALKRYEEGAYLTASTAGKLSFLRLELSAAVEFYEPALASVVAALRGSDELSIAEEKLRGERILRELSELAVRITDQWTVLSEEVSENMRGDAWDNAFERSMLDHMNAILDYVIGCAMYYKTCFDSEKRYDLRHLRVAMGHFSAFLSYEIPLLVGFPALSGLREKAVSYHRILTLSAGLGGEE